MTTLFAVATSLTLAIAGSTPPIPIEDPGGTPVTVASSTPVDPWEGYSDLKKICTCESGLTQYNADGTVLSGRVNPSDKGICQINLYYHEAQALKLDYDLYTEEGNIAYAKWLYDHEGATPWSWSSACHGY